MSRGENGGKRSLGREGKKRLKCGKGKQAEYGGEYGSGKFEEPN